MHGSTVQAEDDVTPIMHAVALLSEAEDDADGVALSQELLHQVLPRSTSRHAFTGLIGWARVGAAVCSGIVCT